MDEQEAIKDIEFIKAAYENLAKNGADRYRAVGENVDCAVEVKTNADLYSHYAVALGMAAEALKKQILIKPKIISKTGDSEYTRCTACKTPTVLYGGMRPAYCPNCARKWDWSEEMTEQEPMLTFKKTAAVGRSEYFPKPKAIYLGFSSHDCESNYRCPCCNKNFGSWSVFNNKENENGTKNYCPNCKTELLGLE